MKTCRRPNLFLGLLLTLLVLGFTELAMAGNTGKNKAGAKNKGPELTVYNEDLALVKETRAINIPSGTSYIRFTDVTAKIDPTSVSFLCLTQPNIRLLEQNYEYDVIGEAKLYQKYLGEKITVTTVKGETITGYLMGTGSNLILAAKPDGGEVKIIKADQIQAVAFTELPGGLVVRPTLVWLVNNKEKPGPQQVQVSYLTGGLSWTADYVAIINADDNRVDLTGWVTLNNQSGTSFEDAKLKLVAGDVHRVPTETVRKTMVGYLAAEVAAPSFAEESLFEYHLYTLDRTTTIKNNQIKQVELLTANAIPAKKLFVYEGSINPNKVKVVLEMVNSKENNLGMPLPKGRMRVQKADSEGSLQFIGEDQIDHTPKDEKIRINLGNAFDITGDRIQTNTTKPSERVRDESYRITLKNHKNEAVTITVIEHFSGWSQWKITKADHKYVKTDAGKAEFTVTVPAGGEVNINYTVRYSW